MAPRHRSETEYSQLLDDEKMLFVIALLQACRGLGQDRGFPVCDRWCADDRVTSACHRVQL